MASDSSSNSSYSSSSSESSGSGSDSSQESLPVHKKKKSMKVGESNEKIWDPNIGESPPSNPTQCLTQLLLSKDMDMFDLTIIIPGYGKSIKAHRLILSIWSSVFKAMLFGPMAEGDTITLEEDPPEAFVWLLNYMYTGQTKLPSAEITLEIYLLANKYLMKHLKTVCSKYLIETVTAVSVPDVLNIASLLDDGALINKCAEVLEESPDSFFSSPTIGSLNSDSLKHLLGKDLPVYSESVIFQGILNWGRSKLESKEKEVTKKLLRQEINQFLPQVRFLSLSLEEFVRHVLREHILTVQEAEAIQLNIAGVPDISLPPLFSTKKMMRNRFQKSLLNTCNITYGSIITNQRQGHVINPCIFDTIEVISIMHLNRIEYDTNIGFSGTLTVKDSSGQELRTGIFDGRGAEFDKPLKMLPKVKYNFTINGVPARAMHRHTYSIGNNGLISGQMLNNCIRPCIFYYWK